MKVLIKREGNRFCLDPISLPGAPFVGRGNSLSEAFGNFLSLQRKNLGVSFEVDPEARKLMIEQYGEADGNQLAEDIAG